MPPRREARRAGGRPRRPPGGPLAWLLVLLVLAAAAAVVAAGALLLAERDYTWRIYPNISVRGVPVGGMRVDEARAAIEQHYGAFLYSPVELRYAGRAWRPSAEDLGIRLITDDALAQAFAIGRGDARLNNLQVVSAAWQQGVDLPLRLEVDQRAMQGYLLRVAAEVDAAPRDADLWLEGAAVVQQAEGWGTQLLIDQTLAEITAAVQGLERQPVELRTRALEPRVRDAELAPVADELRLMLGGPVVLQGETGSCARGCRWELSPAQIAGWIGLRRTSSAAGEPMLLVTLDQGAIRAALLPVAAAVREEGTLPRVRWDDGALRITVPGLPGRGLDADQALALVSGAIYSRSRSVALPMTAIPPPVTETNLASLGITSQVGLGVSSFARSEQYRITNIQAGARRMDGILIPPGASFSFNANLGPVDAANGFVEGLAIIQNRTQKEWGGGLCQVSTTVFRAAFFAGLPITERHEHSFRIGWYEELGEPPGLDAAIFTGVQDMRFVNDSGGWLLVQSAVDTQRQRLSIALYGAPSDRSVSLDYRILEQTPAPTEPVYVDDPEQPAGYFKKTDTARGGLKAEVYRVVRAGDRVIARDTFATEFKPWPDIYVRGTGE